MAVEQRTGIGLLQIGADIYRKTFKRIHGVHRALHWLAYRAIFPLMEQAQSFHTMPDDPFWFRLELLTGRHEPETAAQLRRHIQTGMTVLDIGAHVGYYTRLASERVGTGGHVIAFEPNPSNHAMLRRNVGKRENVTLMQVALAAEEGTAELHDYLMMSASGSLHYDPTLRDVQLASTHRDNDYAPRLEGDFQPRKYTVRTARVDDLLAEMGIQQVDVIKMDIEGAELGALRGMTRTIAQSPKLALIMEYNPLGLQAFGNVPDQALAEVLAMGFNKLYVIQADGSLQDYTQNSAQMSALTEKLMQHMGVVNLLLTR